MSKLKTVVFIFFIIVISACDKSSSNANNAALQDPDIVSNCSSISSSSIGFNVNVMSMQSYDYTQVKINSAPKEFLEGKAYIQFYAWVVRDNQMTDYNMPALKVELYSISQKRPLSYPNDHIGIWDYNAVGANFDTAHLVISGTTKEFILLEMAYISNMGQELGRTLGLLPPFHAGPTTYKDEHTHFGDEGLNFVMQYHPFGNEIGSGIADANYKERAEGSYCFNGMPNN